MLHLMLRALHAPLLRRMCVFMCVRVCVYNERGESMGLLSTEEVSVKRGEEGEGGEEGEREQNEHLWGGFTHLA